MNPVVEGTWPWILGTVLWQYLFALTGAMVWGYFVVRGIMVTLREWEGHRERMKLERAVAVSENRTEPEM